MAEKLLRVLTFTPLSEDHAKAALSDLRRTILPDTDGDTLLFCDLPDAAGEKLPGDVPILRLLQSGVMAIDARIRGRCMLLVRRRVWSQQAHAFIGSRQTPSVFETVSQLISAGFSPAVFEAASVSPASLKAQYACVLLFPLALSCMPDVPARMRAALDASPCGCVYARVIEKQEYPQPILTRLISSGFSLLPPLCSAAPDSEQPVLFKAGITARPANTPPAEDCVFVRRTHTSLSALYTGLRKRCIHAADFSLLLPFAQTALLFLCAYSGMPLLAAAALVPAEFLSFFRLRRLPGALARLALLPLTGAVTLDALLMRTQTKRLRLALPRFFFTPGGCAALGGALLYFAVRSASALTPILPVSLLWLAAPLIIPALDMPASRRIPLDADQLSILRRLAEDAFFSAQEDRSASPAQRMLCACAGSMLGLLEPDEAARRAQACIALPTENAPTHAADIASMLCAAQYLREQMSACDAAMRELPAQIEKAALSRVPAPGGALAALLRTALGAARQETPCPPGALEALFLPLAPANAMAQHAVTLPLTHPHTFIRRHLLSLPQENEDSSAANRFLSLAAAALSHPFYPLLLRSPVTAPYAPMLYGA